MKSTAEPRGEKEFGIMNLMCTTLREGPKKTGKYETQS